MIRSGRLVVSLKDINQGSRSRLECSCRSDSQNKRSSSILSPISAAKKNQHKPSYY